MEVSVLTVKNRNTPEPNPLFEETFTAYWPKIYGILFRLVNDREEAQDLALETFWRLYQHWPGLSDPQNLGGWLYRVAMNLGYNALRSWRRRSHYEGRAGRQALQSDKAADPAVMYEQVEQRQEVLRILAGMKPRSAQALVFHSSGLSYAEIAAALNVAPGSVGTLLARAEQEFLRRYLARFGRFE